MAVYPLTFPARMPPSSERLELSRRQAAAVSPFTLAQQTINTASQWRLTWTWAQMYLSTAEAMSAWLNSLRGQVGTFYYTPRQSRSYANLTNRSLNLTGYAFNSEIQVRGWNANALSGLYTGQYLQIGEQLLQIVSAPVNADSGGVCTIEFEPGLRLDFAAGTHVEFAAPAGKFRMMGSDGAAFTLSPGGLAEFGTIQAQEAVE